MKTHAPYKTLLLGLAAQALIASAASATVTKLAHYGLGESGTVTGATSPFTPLLDDIGGHHFAGQQAVGSTATLGTSGVAAVGSTAYLAKSSWPSGWHSTNFSLTNDWSVQLWMRPDTNGGTVQFETDNNATGVSFVFSSDNKIYLAHGGGGTQNAITGANSSYTTGTWYRLGIVNYNGTNHFYINGTEVTTDALGGTVGGMLLGFAQGGNNGGPGAYDELNVWSFDHTTDSLSSITDALNAGIVNALYWDGAPGTANGASDGGSGTWSASVADWDRGSGNGFQGWTGTAIPAVFAGTAGTVTMDGVMNAGSVAFNAAGYVIDTGTNSPTWTVLGGTGGVTKAGTGTLTLTSASTASGALTVNGGTLALGDSGALGSTSVVLNGGGISRNVPATTIANAISIGAGGGTITGRTAYWDNWVSLSGPITGSGALTIKGMVALRNSSNSYSGTLSIVNAGSLNFATAGSSALALLGGANQVSSNLVIHLADSGSAVYIGSAQTIDQLAGTGVVWGPGPLTVGGNNGSSSFGGAINDTIILTKTGTGTFALTGTNSFTGATTINNGVLELNGSLANTPVSVEGTGTLQGTGTVAGAVTVNSGGTLSPGGAAIGTLTVSNTLTLAGDTRMQINSGSMTSDTLSGMTGVTYGGTLTVTDLGSALAVGQKFMLFTKVSGTYDGSFSTLNLPTPPNGCEWNTSGLASDGSIQLTALNQVAAPTFLPAAGGYCVPVAVTISSDPDSTIYYTMNGDTPTLFSAHGSTPLTDITIPPDTQMTIKSFATKTGMANSAVASATYTTLSTAAWLNPAGGSWTNANNWLRQVIATGAGSTADFSTLDLTANATVTLNSEPTVGKLVFGDTTPDFNWTLNAGGPLTLDAGGTPPVIEVKNQITSLAVAIAGTSGCTKTGNGTLTLGAQNSFTGTMKVSGGSVEINNAPEWGRGFAGANATVEIDSGATVKLNTVWALGFTSTCDDLTIHDGGVLNCNGQTTYVRHIVLEGSANISNNTAVDSNISLGGNLTTTPTDAAAPQLQLLRLSGSAYGVVGGTTTFTVNDNANQPVDLTIGPIFQSSSAALLKTGAGTMLMTGANSYTGRTTVNNGSLLLTGSISTGTVAVNANATLGGTGTINSATTIADNGRLAFTLSTLAASHVPLKITGALVFSGASVLDITTSGVLAAPGIYPLVVATAPITGSVPATLSLPAGWAATASISADALSLLLTVTSTGTSPYDTWSNGTFANAFTDKNPSHDPDGDGMTNLQEYAFGTDPTVSSSGAIVYDATSVTSPGAPEIVEEGGVYYAVFGRRADYLSAGILYTLRFSADLEAGYWTTSATEPTELTSTGSIHAVRVPYPIGLIPSASGPQDAKFFQVGVSQAP
ncbi:MAG: autotransporter-associated beta strand repeat-containing protein [Verrucomicrobiota bacterium]